MELEEEGSFHLNFLHSNIKGEDSQQYIRPEESSIVSVSVVLPTVHHIIMTQNFTFATFLRGLTRHNTNMPTPTLGRKLAMLLYGHRPASVSPTFIHPTSTRMQQTVG